MDHDDRPPLPADPSASMTPTTRRRLDSTALGASFPDAPADALLPPSQGGTWTAAPGSGEARSPVWTVAGARDGGDEAAPEGSGDGPIPHVGFGGAGGPSMGPAYRLHRVVGRGGMGEVWEATQATLGRRVALKRLRADRLGPASGDTTHRAHLCEEFRLEAIANAALEHPNIVPIHDLGVDERGVPVLAMKLVRGEPWSTSLAADFAALPVEEYLARHLPVLVDVAQAITFAHARGIVHRDIKPAQVMVGPYGETLLTDWGLAIRCDVAPAPPRAAAGEGGAPPLGALDGIAPLPTPRDASNPAGTPVMMAPEQTDETAERVGPWTDVFLLGGTLYYVLTGTYPHEAIDSRVAVALARLAEVEPPSARRPERRHPPELEQLCLAAMARDPAARVHSAAAFLAALQDHLSGATRRREAERLLAGARARLAGAAGYADVREGLALLRDAAAAWPRHPDLAPLAEEAHVRFARLALEQGDLRLARLEAEQLEAAAAPRAALMEEVAAAERRQRAHRHQRRVAIAAALLLASAVAVGSAFFSLRLDEKNQALDASNRALDAKNQQLEERTQAAIAQARDVRRLVTFLLEDLGEQLDFDVPRDRAIADALTARAMTYARSVEAAALAPGLAGEVGETLANVALSLGMLGRHDDAIEAGRVAMDVVARQFAATAPEYLFAQMALGAALTLGEQYDEGLALLAAAERGYRAAGPDHLRGTIEAAHHRAVALFRLHRLDEELEALLLEIDAAAPAVYAEGNVSRANVPNLLSEMYRLRGDYERAAHHASRAIDILRASDSHRHRDAVAMLIQAGTIELERGRYADADRWLHEARDHARSHLHPLHPHLLLLHNSLGESARRAGRAAEAVEHFTRGRDIGRRIHGDEPNTTLAMVINNLAVTHAGMGDNQRALDLLHEAGEAFARIDPEHPNLGTIAGSRASLALRLGQFDLAEQLLADGIARQRRAGIADHSATLLPSLVNELRLRVLRGRPEGVEEECARLLRLIDEHLGGESTFTSIVLETRGVAVLASGRPADAVAILREALERAVAAAGDASQRADNVRGSLARALFAAGERDAARAEAERGLPVFRRLFAPEFPERADLERIAAELGLPPAPAPSP